jgi:erythromycin esterase-like protein
MTSGFGVPSTGVDVAAEIRSLAHPLVNAADLDPVIRLVDDARFVAIGDASHGTHEYYEWRAILSRRLIEERGFTWIGVEGDWPDCWRINRWVRGHEYQDRDAAGLLAGFERWPTWMWANREVADFLDWLHAWNAALPVAERVGFYGLDVYSLWDSLREIMGWLKVNAPDAVPAALAAWHCFAPYGEDPQRYAWGTRLVPVSCEADVVGLLAEVLRRTQEQTDDDEAAFDAAQNSVVTVNAEQYYRTMVRGDRESCHVRDRHMAATIDRIADHLGPSSRGLIWEHNTHIGDARATDMVLDALVNVGQLMREEHSDEGVVLIGTAGYGGTVIAADNWGQPERIFRVPDARQSSHESHLHRVLGHQALLVFDPDRSGAWLSLWRDHRAIGVVYRPEYESGNYVPTRLGARYDALLWFEETTALHPLHPEPRATEPEFETEPTGF